MGLVFSISNFFITKTPLANIWRRKKIPSCSYSALKTGDLKNWQTYFTIHKMVQVSNICISNGFPMHQNFILKLFELLWHIQILYRTVLIGLYSLVLLLWFFEFGRIFELYKMHWIYQNWLRILQDKSKIYIIICWQAFWVVKLLFESKFWYGLPTFVT